MIDLPRMKPLTWLVLLLVFHFLLLSFQIRNRDGLILFKVWGLVILSPVAEGIHAGWSATNHFLDRYRLLSRAEDENASLRRENARLRVEVNRLRGLTGLLPRTRDFAAVRSVFDFDTVEGTVIARSAPFLTRQVLINRGTTSGVEADCAVFVPEGIVGRVRTSSLFSSEVELIVNDRAAVGALLARSRIHGIVQGNGTTSLEMNYVPNSLAVAPGETVLTSGTDRVYPKGIPVGRVVAVREGPVVFREIQIEPFVDFFKVEEVLVVLKDRATESREPEATGPGQSPESREVSPGSQP